MKTTTTTKKKPSSTRPTGNHNGNASSKTHVPFQEFQAKTLDELVSELEKTKPDGSLVEVTPIEDMQHSPCMQEMSTVVVHGDETHTVQEHPNEMVAVYQYCAACKAAVRIL